MEEFTYSRTKGEKEVTFPVIHGSVNRATIYHNVRRALQKVDVLPLDVFEKMFPDAGANLDIAIARMADWVVDGIYIYESAGIFYAKLR